jgi:hypothetical protein
MNCVMRVITEDNIDQIESMSFSDNYKILSGQTENIDESLEKGRGQKSNSDEFRLVISESNPNPNPNTDDIVEQKSDENDDSEGVIMTEDASASSASSASSADLQMLQANLVASQSKQGANANANASTNLESGEKDSLGKEWTKMIDQESGKEYYYNELTKDTMWFTPQPSKDYELRPPFGWYAIDNAGHIYLHNPQKNLIKMPEDVTFADANERPEEAVEKKEEPKSESLPSILMIEKTGETDDDESGSSSSNGGGDKKIIM